MLCGTQRDGGGQRGEERQTDRQTDNRQITEPEVSFEISKTRAVVLKRSDKVVVIGLAHQQHPVDVIIPHPAEHREGMESEGGVHGEHAARDARL